MLVDKATGENRISLNYTILNILYSTRVLIPTKILINLCYVSIKSYKHIIRGENFMERVYEVRKASIQKNRSNEN